MLQVGVHHENPCAACVPRAGNDGAAQTALAGARWPVYQAYRHRAGRGAIGQDRLSTVVAVINDDDLRLQRHQRRSETLQERPDIAFLVARRNNHGQAARAARGIPVQFRRCTVQPRGSAWIPTSCLVTGRAFRCRQRPESFILDRQSPICLHFGLPPWISNPFPRSTKQPRGHELLALSRRRVGRKYQRRSCARQNDKRGGTGASRVAIKRP